MGGGEGIVDVLMAWTGGMVVGERFRSKECFDWESCLGGQLRDLV